MRSDPLSFLADELNCAQGPGPLSPPARSRRQAGGAHDDRRPRSRQSFVEQLSGPDDAPAAQGESAGGDRAVRCRHRLGAHNRRDDGDSHGARAAARRVQENRSRRRVSERLRRERRDRRRHPHQGRLRHFRRAEPREHHRRRASQPGVDQGLSRIATRAPRAPSCATCRQRRAGC